MSAGFMVSSVVSAIQTAESMKLQEKLQAESIAAQEKMQQKQMDHEKEMLRAQEAMNSLSQGGSEQTDADGYYDEDGNYHFNDGSGYLDKDGNFHLADGSGYYDKDMNFYYSDGSGYLDKDGNYFLSDGSGYYDKDGNFYPSDGSGVYDKDGNFTPSEDGGNNIDEDEIVDERFEDAVLLEKNEDSKRRSTYAMYYEDVDYDNNDITKFETGVSEARTLKNKDRFEKFIDEGILTYRQLQAIKENIEGGRMNFFMIEYMYEQDILTLDQSNAALEMLEYFQSNGSFK